MVLMARTLVSSGSPWEGPVGFSRAVRVGSLVVVAGTTAADAEGRVVGPGDPYLQTKVALQRIEAALTEVGASLSDVVRTRLFVTDITCWEEIGRAHGEVFRGILPATSMVEVSRLIDPAMLVEVEAMAVIDAPDARRGEE